MMPWMAVTQLLEASCTKRTKGISHHDRKNLCQFCFIKSMLSNDYHFCQFHFIKLMLSNHFHQIVIFDQSIASTKTKYIKLNTKTNFLKITFNFCIHFERENFFLLLFSCRPCQSV